MAYLGLGDADEAIRWLDRAYAERDVHMIFLGADPKWDTLGGDPRFADVLQRLGLRG